jgi:hypothetical protein
MRFGTTSLVLGMVAKFILETKILTRARASKISGAFAASRTECPAVTQRRPWVPGGRDPLNRAAADAGLLGDLVKGPGAARASRMRSSSLVSMKGRPQCSPSALARAMPAFTPPADHRSLELGKHTHLFETLLCLPESS